VTVPQFGQIATFSGMSFPHRSQVVMACLSFVLDALLSAMLMTFHETIRPSVGADYADEQNNHGYP
jgi:hypothetical protein